MARGRKIIRRFGAGIVILFFVFGAFIVFTDPGRAIQDFWRNGTIQSVLFPAKDRNYSANSEGNLRAIRTALMLYHDSEGQFPTATGWMDAIETRITATDMSIGEAKKKLIRPDLTSRQGAFGYALNDLAAGKYRDDVGTKTVLVYESKQTSKNAHGNPSTDRFGYAITVDGTIQNH